MKWENKLLLENAAGLDIGSTNIYVADGSPGYRTFGTFTQDFGQAAQHLKDSGVTHVAMEATGVYRIGLYDILKQQGLYVDLEKAGDAKHLPGRSKDDGADSQWIQKLYSHALLRNCFVPEEHIVKMRTYVRHRQQYIEMGAQHIQHMQKAMITMNIRLPQVISQITGASGRRIIQAIIAGERDAKVLAELCDGQIKNKKFDDVVKSLEGRWRVDQLFVLKTAYQA